MKSGDLVKQFGVSHTTITRWVNEFAEYLSESAKGVNQKQKTFTSDDFLVIATIHQLSVDGLSLVEIGGKLKSGYRVENITSATIGYDDGRMVPASAMEQIIDATGVAAELMAVKSERDKLVDMLEASQEKLTEKEIEIRALNDRIADLQYRLGQAEGELKLRQEQAQTPKKRWWGGD